MKQVQVIAKSRKERQNVSAFAALVASPVTGAITLPAGARLAFRSVAGASAGTTASTIAGTSNRTIKTPALAAGESMTLDHVERAAVVTPAACFEVLIDIGLGRFAKIGEGA